MLKKLYNISRGQVSPCPCLETGMRSCRLLDYLYVTRWCGRFRMSCVTVRGWVGLWSNSMHRDGRYVNSTTGQRASSQRLCRSVLTTLRERGRWKVAGGGRRWAEGDAWTMWEACTSAAAAESYGRRCRRRSRQKTFCEFSTSSIRYRRPAKDGKDLENYLEIEDPERGIQPHVFLHPMTDWILCINTWCHKRV